jgi:hypothetical protein
MSVDISSPAANTTVERSFPADGSYDLSGMGTVSSAKVRCWVTYQGQEKDSEDYTIPDPGMLSAGSWDVTLTVDNNYANCTVHAQLYINGSATSSTASVEHVNIQTA